MKNFYFVNVSAVPDAESDRIRVERIAVERQILSVCTQPID